MESLLNNLPKQLLFTPQIVNSFKLKPGNKFLFLGMGGSHLAADLMKISHPYLNIIIHSNFNLPYIDDLKERNIILISY
ncbi:MAG: hypothetical protein NZ866_00910, partial [Patescibacteria group bacterium]|nr:hypothetical protein [Patescibacteria group bacterium]